MKKFLSFLLIVSLILVSGCSQPAPSTATDMDLAPAIESKLLSLYGADQESVMSAYSLSDDHKDKQWTAYYLGNAAWCGEETETKFLFTDDALTLVKTSKVLANNSSAQDAISEVITKFNNQFSSPKAWTVQLDWVPEPKQDYHEEQFEEKLKAFWNAENGSLLCLSYESEEITTDEPYYIECVFLRNENKNPGKVYVILKIGNASFGYIDENIDLKLLA